MTDTELIAELDRLEREAHFGALSVYDCGEEVFLQTNVRYLLMDGNRRVADIQGDGTYVLAIAHLLAAARNRMRLLLTLLAERDAEIARLKANIRTVSTGDEIRAGVIRADDTGDKVRDAMGG